MSKSAVAIILTLAVLVCVQTWRLSRSESALAKSGVADEASRERSVLPADSPAVAPAASIDPKAPPGSQPSPEASLALDLAGGSTRGDSASPPSNSSTEREGRTRRGQHQRQATQPDAETTDPDAINRTIDLARRRMRAGHSAEAIQLLTKALEETPTSARGYRELARMYQQLGMTTEEIATLQDWQENIPDDAYARIRLAAAYEAQGMTAEALAELDAARSLVRNPGDYRAMAQLYDDLGLPAEEGDALQAWVSADPQSVEARLALAGYYRRNQDPAAAIDQYQQALTVAPGNVQAALGLASTYERTRQYELAQDQLMQVIEQRPGEIQAWMMLAENYRHTGDLASAAATYQSVIDMRPDSTEAFQAARAIDRINRQIQRAQAQQGGKGMLLAEAP